MKTITGFTIAISLLFGGGGQHLNHKQHRGRAGILMSDAALAEIAGRPLRACIVMVAWAARSATSQAASSAAAIDRCCSLDWRRESTTSSQTSHMVYPRLRFAAVDDTVRTFADHQVQLVERQALVGWSPARRE